MAQAEALVFSEREKEIEIRVVVAVQSGLLHKWLKQHTDGYVGLLLQRVLHVSCEKLAENRLVVVLDEGECQHVEQIRGARVRLDSELVEQPEQRHVRGELQLKVGVAAALQGTGRMRMIRGDCRAVTRSPRENRAGCGGGGEVDGRGLL